MQNIFSTLFWTTSLIDGTLYPRQSTRRRRQSSVQRRKKSKSDENFEKFHQAGQSNSINDQKVTFTKNHHFGQFEMSGEFLPVIQKESLI